MNKGHLHGFPSSEENIHKSKLDKFDINFIKENGAL